MALHLSKRKPLYPVQNKVFYLCFSGSKEMFEKKKIKLGKLIRLPLHGNQLVYPYLAVMDRTLVAAEMTMW